MSLTWRNCAVFLTNKSINLVVCLVLCCRTFALKITSRFVSDLNLHEPFFFISRGTYVHVMTNICTQRLSRRRCGHELFYGTPIKVWSNYTFLILWLKMIVLVLWYLGNQGVGEGVLTTLKMISDIRKNLIQYNNYFC